MTAIAGLVVHPAAELFPMMSGEAFEAFVADIRENGQAEPVVLDVNDQLIDGRNRASACERLGITPTTKRYEGTDVVQYVVSHNLHRRHLTDSQRAMIAAKLAQRKPGQRAGEGNLSDITKIPPSIAEAAELLGVGGSSVQKAKIVVGQGTDDLQDLVASGKAPVTTAARVAAELTPAEQNAYVEKVLVGMHNKKRRTNLLPEWVWTR